MLLINILVMLDTMVPISPIDTGSVSLNSLHQFTLLFWYRHNLKRMGVAPYYGWRLYGICSEDEFLVDPIYNLACGTPAPMGEAPNQLVWYIIWQSKLLTFETCFNVIYLLQSKYITCTKW